MRILACVVTNYPSVLAWELSASSLIIYFSATVRHLICSFWNEAIINGKTGMIFTQIT